MKAAIYHGFGEPIRIEELPDPTPEAQGVVIQVGASGVCRSDWHGWMGHDPDIHLPQIPGHELAGAVVATGTDVRGFAAGDRVTVPFCCGCGRCAQCQAGNEHICDDHYQPGFTGPGSFAEFVPIRFAETNLVRVPRATDFVTAASLGCRFITAYRAVRHQGRPRPGDWVAVHGCGGVGLSAVMIAKAAGAKVVAVDIDRQALELAADLGADELMDAADETPIPTRIRAVTGGGAHVSLDALGHEQTCVNSVLSLRKRGRHVQVGLLPGGTTPLPMDQVIGRELELFGSHGMQAHEYPPMLAAIEAGELQPQRLVTRTIGLTDVPQVLAAMNDPTGGPERHGGVTVVDFELEGTN